MIIELNVNSLISNELNASQFIILLLLFEGRYNTLNTYFKATGKKDLDIEDLIERKFVLSWDSDKQSEGIVINKAKVKELLSYDDAFFWELFSTYPIKVASRGGGVRSLRALSHTAKETVECKKKYEKYLGKRTAKQKHEHVMKCLDGELLTRGKSNSMAFMHELTTYINKQAWSRYEYLLEISNQSTKSMKYGEELI